MGRVMNTQTASKSENSEPRQLVFQISQATVLGNKLKRMHWAEYARLRERYYWDFRLAIGRDKPVTMQKCNIHIDRYASGKLPDWENLYFSFKPVIDCLVKYNSQTHPHGLGVIYDDNPKYLLQLTGLPKSCKKGLDRTIIYINEVV